VQIDVKKNCSLQTSHWTWHHHHHHQHHQHHLTGGRVDQPITDRLFMIEHLFISSSYVLHFEWFSKCYESATCDSTSSDICPPFSWEHVFPEFLTWLITYFQWLSLQQETRPYISCFLLGCCDHSTHTSAKWKETLRRIQKKVTEVSTWLNKGPKVYCESVFAVGS
jgi:hypothetical protein